MLLEDGTVVTSKLGRKRKNRSPKPQRKLPDTSAITEHSPEAPSLNSETLDFDDPGYLTATTVMDSDYDEETASDWSRGRLTKKAKVMMPPAPGAAINVNLNGRIRSHAQPVAQCSQLPALGPTLAELHARNDLPDNIRHWVALSTTTATQEQERRLEEANRGCFQAWALSGWIFRTRTQEHQLMKYGQAERFNQKIHQSGQSSLRVPWRARDQASLVDEKATGNAINIDDLPQGATVGNRWCEKFIPTVLQYLGTLSNPWDLPDGVILHVPQNVWDIVYGESLPWTIAIDDCVHAIAMWCIHEWQGYFGSSALRAFELLFQSSPHEFPDFQTCAVFFREILPDGRLFYECTYDGVNRGLYQSRFVLAALSEHVNATRGAVHVPKLYPAGYAKHPYGAIGLSAAAVFREAMLFSWKRIGYDNNKHLVVLKSINESAGKLTSKDTAFSEQNFGERTRECATSASKLSAAKIATIFDYASQSITMTEWSAAALSFSANTHKCNFANLVDVD
ncbi:hypothetical protein LXA43DRAFT_1068217 [Ganoderma leucocontextum]|nr:hypothetical protein LXA43DRAFT_1068217 [Ganoderma leucocontextum]